MGTPVWPAQIAVKALMDEGFDTLFGITGGHISSVDDYWTIYSNRLYHMRHEQACGYAAEAYARATGKPGLALATVGPGTCNMVSAINQQYWCNAPVRKNHLLWA